MDEIDLLFQGLDEGSEPDPVADAQHLGDSLLAPVEDHALPSATDFLVGNGAKPDLSILLRRLFLGEDRLSHDEQDTVATLLPALQTAYDAIAQVSLLPRLPACWPEHLESVTAVVGVVLSVREVMSTTKAFDVVNFDAHLATWGHRIQQLPASCFGGTHVARGESVTEHPFPSVSM